MSSKKISRAQIPVAPLRTTKTHRRGNRKTILPPRRSRRQPQARQGQPQALQSRRPQSRRRRQTHRRWRKAHPDVEPASELLKRILAERRAKWNGKGKYKEPAPPDTGNLPALSTGWCWVRLEQLGFIFGGFTKNPQRD